jgi:hypothetical protein
MENWEEADVSNLDVEELLARFQNLRKQKFKPQVLETYKRRFRNAVRSYLEYLHSPGTWRPTNQDRSVTTDRSRHASAAPITASAVGSAPHPRAAGEMEYPFPLRPGFMARLFLPVDLTNEEVTRIQNFVGMLVVNTGKTDGASWAEKQQDATAGRG